jgi:dihydrofolate synthase/folylpolyglutamate synthase
VSKDPVLEQKLERLYACRNSGIKFGLDVQRELMGILGNPQDSYAVIHVAGTNGKGSVCTIIESILRTAGVKVGLYTSPHLVEFNERITVNGVRATDGELLGLSKVVDAAIPQVDKVTGREPSFFEYSTAMAFKHFADNGVQVAVLETGMGGRLDATNVVNPMISVITRISLEHTEYLGSDIASIAKEKAGIIKPGRPVVCGAMPIEAKRVISEGARDAGSLFRDVEDTVSINMTGMSLSETKASASTEGRNYGALRMKLIGTHQIENLATAIAAVEEVERVMGVDLPEDAVKVGLAEAVWPGRFHVLSTEPPMILDGAHNAGAAQVLDDTLRKVCGKKPLGLILGVCGDKDLVGMLEGFSNLKRIWAVGIGNERSMSADEIAASAIAMGYQCEPSDLPEALHDAEEWAIGCDGVVCIAGSLFLAGEVLELKGAI